LYSILLVTDIDEECASSQRTTSAEGPVRSPVLGVPRMVVLLLTVI
jgi:hypothetical protein